MKKIPLTQGKFALVDDEDFELLNQWKWCASNDRGIWYAIRSQWNRKDKVNNAYRMHRIIMNAKKGESIDHKNRDGLDNRRENLRICTHKENMFNRTGNKNTSSQYKSVCWSKKENKWVAHIKKHGKNFRLGAYNNEMQAARIYDYWAVKLFGKFAHLNLSYDLISNDEYKEIRGGFPPLTIDQLYNDTP